jgi:hypothetical protein
MAVSDVALFLLRLVELLLNTARYYHELDTTRGLTEQESKCL